MSTRLFDRVFGWFLRIQATLAALFLYAQVLNTERAGSVLLLGAIATDIARFALRNRTSVQVYAGALVVLLGLSVSGYAAWTAASPFALPSADFEGQPVFSAGSPFLLSLEAAGGGPFLYAQTVAMILVVAGIFLLFASERSAYVRRQRRVERPDRLGLFAMTMPWVLQLFFLLLGALALSAGVTNRAELQDAAQALASFPWRLSLAAAFLIPCAPIVIAAGSAWFLLNGFAIVRAETR